MLNLIKSFIVTFVSVIVAFVSAIRGPLLVGLTVGAIVLSFTKKANAASQPVFVSFSFSETFAIVSMILAGIVALVLFISESK